MVIGILVVLACTAMLGFVVGLALYGDALAHAVRQHLPAPPRPAGPPLEQIVADLRRIRAEVVDPAPGASHVRRVAALAAYDDALADACRALGHPDLLSELPVGPDRDAERLRTEWLLEESGIRFTTHH